jgi:hypothetical protein
MCLVRVYNRLKPPAARGKKDRTINIGKAEDIALNNDVYHLYMPRYDVFDHTPCAFLNEESDYVKNKEKWDEADLSELNSLVLEHRV